MISEQFEKFKDEFETKISLDMSKLRIPGTAIALVEKGKIIYESYYGTKDRSINEPIDQKTIFGIGSCSKSFTSLVIVQLAEKGLLNLDDPVLKYLPLKLGFKNKPITIRNLMSHASGIPSLGTSLTLFYVLGMNIDVPIIPLSTKEDVFRFINNAHSELFFEPKEKFFYFNGGYTLLGYLIETISGIPYEDYIKKHIFEPLGMTESSFQNDKTLNSNSNLAKGYLNKNLDIIPVQTTVDHVNNPAGGIVSTISDLQKYLIALITRQPKLLSKSESYDEIFSCQNKTEMFENLIPNAEQNGYGFGWALFNNFHGKKVICHGGNSGNYSAGLLLIPEIELALIILSNGSTTPDVNHAVALIQSYLGIDPEKENIIYKRKEKIQRICGSYQTYRGLLKLTVINKGGTLFLESKSEKMPINQPIFPKTDELDCLDYFYYNPNGLKQKIFFIEKNNKFYLKFERYLFTKM